MGLYFIAFVLMFANMAATHAQIFRGSSQYVLFFLNLVGLGGYALFTILSIWAFFVYIWWHALIMVILAYIIMPTMAVYLIKLLPWYITMFGSALGVLLFSTLSALDLLNIIS